MNITEILKSEDVEKLYFVKLDENYLCNIESFSCLDESEEFQGFKSKKIKKFKRYSSNLDDFIRNDAITDQNSFLSTTHLLIFDNELVGYVTICADSIVLCEEEKDEDNVKYSKVPSVKIAKLGINNSFQRKGFGKFIINYAILMIESLRDAIGVRYATVDCYPHRVSYYKKFGFVENVIQKEGREPDSPVCMRLDINKYFENQQDIYKVYDEIASDDLEDQ